jgi:hypothetical protein
MALAPGAEVPDHVDAHYYWRTHIRIHIPVITNPGVIFTCGGASVHMAAGECWVFDSFQWHDVQNRGSERRVHLVLDTVGGERLSALLASANAGQAQAAFSAPTTDRYRPAELAFEQVNAPKVMSPWEMRCHLAFLAEQAVPDPRLGLILGYLDQFADGWAAHWARFGDSDAGLPGYREMLAKGCSELSRLPGTHLVLRNELHLYMVLDQLVLQMAVAPPQPVDAFRAAAVEGGERRLAS